MSRRRSIRVPGRRVSKARGATYAGLGLALLTLAVFTADVFSPASVPLRIAAIWMLSAGLAACWVAVLSWRPPVSSRSALVGLGLLWGLGMTAAVYLTLRATTLSPPSLQLGTRLLAVSLSLVVGGLFLRALLRVRTSPRLGRLLSLVSPLAILLLILTLGRQPP